VAIQARQTAGSIGPRGRTAVNPPQVACGPAWERGLISGVRTLGGSKAAATLRGTRPHLTACLSAPSLRSPQGRLPSSRARATRRSLRDTPERARGVGRGRGREGKAAGRVRGQAPGRREGSKGGAGGDGVDHRPQGPRGCLPLSTAWDSLRISLLRASVNRLFGSTSHGDDDFSFGASFSKIPECFRNLT
jgi:hypothetical protein